MTRRLLLLTLFCLTLGLAIYPSTAAPNPDEGLYSMAQYFPANTEVFVATRIDEAFVEEIDQLVVKLSRNFTEFGIPSMPATQLAQFALGIDIDEMLAWLGDYGAFAQYPSLDDSSFYSSDLFSAVILLDDPASADVFLTETMPRLTRTEEDDNIVFDDGFFEIIITPSTLEMYISESKPSLADGTLLDTENYREAVAQLPYDTYNIGLYIDVKSQLTQQMPFTQMDVIEHSLSSFAIGLTSVDDVTLIADIVHAPLEYIEYDDSGRVNTTFLSYIPDTMTTVAIASDLSNVISTSIDALDAIMEEQEQFSDSPSPDIYEEFEELGIDLQSDILDWMTGEYAVFGDNDLIPIVKDALAFELNLSGRIELGVIADASTDPVAAQRLADSLVELMLNAPQDDAFTIRQDVIAGVDVTVIAVNEQIQNPLVQVECNQPPAMSDLSFELVLGVTDELFVFATRPLADTILAGDYQSIDSTVDYQKATEYFLPDPTSIWYADGEGFTHSVIFNPAAGLMLMGPQIGCIFENIIAQLDTDGTATPAPMPTALPSPTPDFKQIDRQVRPLEIAPSLIQSASITSTVTDEGVIQLRFVISINL